MRFTIAGIVGGLVTLISGTLIAILMQPVLTPYFGELIRKEGEDGLLFPSLMSGYFVIGFCLTYLAPKLGVLNMKWSEICVLGAVMGLSIFFGDHLITAGWSRLSAQAMMISGMVDSLSVVFGFAAIAFVLRHNVGKQESR